MFELDHIGIAVNNIEISQNIFKILNFKFEKVENVQSQGVKVSFSKGESKLELLEGNTEFSPKMPILPNPIKSFIHKNGEGLHHICFRTKEIESAFEMIKKQGVKILSNNIETGAGGHRMFFIHPKYTKGLLIEIIERND